MWTKLPFSDFYIYFRKANLIEIYVTDFISIWSKYFTSENFLKCVKENNETLEGAEEYELLTNAIDMLVNVESLIKSEISQDEQSAMDILLVKINSDHGYPVKLNLNLKEDSKEVFFQKITYPLLKSTQDFLMSQNELCKLLENKDKEIDVYKKEGGKIALRHKTPIFDHKQHMSYHNKYSENFAFTSVVLPKDKLISIKNTTTIFMFKQELINDLDTDTKVTGNTEINNKDGDDRKQINNPQNVVINSKTNEQDLLVKNEDAIIEELSLSIKQESESQFNQPSNSGIIPRKKIKKSLANL